MIEFLEDRFVVLRSFDSLNRRDPHLLYLPLNPSVPHSKSSVRILLLWRNFEILILHPTFRRALLIHPLESVTGERSEVG